MTIEPHTIDTHDFDEDCPDCASLCATALVEILVWVTTDNRYRRTSMGRVAALCVVTKQMTAVEAAQYYGVSRRMVNYNVEKLATKFGLRYKHGKVL
jgi:hypothetical protein